jgi:hypothetical protein
MLPFETKEHHKGTLLQSAAFYYFCSKTSICSDKLIFSAEAMQNYIES